MDEVRGASVARTGSARRRPPRPRESDVVRRLALAKLHELRRLGMSYSEIGRRYGRGPEGDDLPQQRRLRSRFSPERRLPNRRPSEGEAEPERHAFLAAIDALGQRLLFYGCDGEIVHATRALQEALARKGGSLAEQIHLFGASACGLARLRAGENLAVIERMAVEELAGSPPRRLVASYIGLDLFGNGPTVLIALESSITDPLDPAVLKRRFGFTAAQCRVARLLAHGRRNREIAEALCLSPHTARNHTQRILHTLDVHSRAEVASVLLRLHVADQK